MHIPPQKAKFLRSALKEWEAEGRISDQQRQELESSIQVVFFDWQKLARYAFWFAIASTIISVSAVLSDRWLMAMIQKLFSAPDTVKLIFSTLVTVFLYNRGLKRRRLYPHKRFSNEALFFLGVLGTALCVALLGKILDDGSGHFSILLLLASLIYGGLGLWFPSTLVWVFGLLSLGGWLGAETGYLSGWGAYYLGMNYPLRFTLFGLVLLALSGLFNRWPRGRAFIHSTRAMGLLYFFISLWMMSIFGNYGDIGHWNKAGHDELALWSVLFGAAALAAIYHGIRYQDPMTRGFGIVFLGINLYTRFFEYFWDSMHKALFFALLAASFWYLGTHAERLWNLGRPQKAPSS
ncbi:hypothetical protein [Thiolapillus brandeum]|uniref:DUF2157 domain-containing protein n=1 Tax=Thiolapillus brandeum TaxID=1076588 RepID=A0A7U6GKF6_9GAMM|nr:hypothetical protein [Thiolapillus brandeum]BAO45286.1 conserved hypothetical protein [Thiolapillus brandeum]